MANIAALFEINNLNIIPGKTYSYNVFSYEYLQLKEAFQTCEAKQFIVSMNQSINWCLDKFVDENGFLDSASINKNNIFILCELLCFNETEGPTIKRANEDVPVRQEMYFTALGFVRINDLALVNYSKEIGLNFFYYDRIEFKKISHSDVRYYLEQISAYDETINEKNYGLELLYPAIIPFSIVNNKGFYPQGLKEAVISSNDPKKSFELILNFYKSGMYEELIFCNEVLLNDTIMANASPYDHFSEIISNDDPDDNLYQTFIKKFNQKYLPEKTVMKVYEELKKLQQFLNNGSNSGEKLEIIDYLNFILKLPFEKEVKEEIDINKVSMALNKSHYGMEDVKERILEYLSIRKRVGITKSPILCLVGPPGVGKTSLVKEIAKACDKAFIKVSLGGVSDDAYLKGFLRTYRSARAGIILQEMCEAKMVNPIFLLDEIDKISIRNTGNPSNVLMELLDPNQNNEYFDNYLEMGYDMSKVFFIATANFIENIDPILRDRLEILELRMYSENEKIEIAKKYIIPKIKDEYKINNIKVKISDEILFYLIRFYTAEAGVRSLERALSTIFRKITLDSDRNGRLRYTINKKIIHEYLGDEKVDYGLSSQKDQIGYANGLYATSIGGGVLPIEVAVYEGKGNFVLTGQLGDVLSESAKIAIDLIKARAKEFKVDPSIFNNSDLHIHLPEGAIKKDGPSAGIALTSAILSALTKRSTKCHIAMTGEVSLKGNVLKIGGLRSKILGAYNIGIKEFIIPMSNKKDLKEIPEEILKQLKIHCVTTIDEVIRLILND